MCQIISLLQLVLILSVPMTVGHRSEKLYINYSRASQAIIRSQYKKFHHKLLQYYKGFPFKCWLKKLLILLFSFQIKIFLLMDSLIRPLHVPSIWTWCIEFIGNNSAGKLCVSVAACLYLLFLLQNENCCWFWAGYRIV